MKLRDACLIGFLLSDCMRIGHSFFVSELHLLRRGLSSCFQLYAKPLASEDDWSAYLDEEGTGFIYYFNAKTGESLWEKPTKSFPEVSLERTMQRMAAEKQEAYLKSLKTEKKGFFQTILDTPAAIVEPERTSPSVVEPKRVDSDWFGSIFEQSSGAATVESKSKPEIERRLEVKEESDWFSSFRDRIDKPIDREPGASVFGKLFSSATTDVVAKEEVASASSMPTPTKTEEARKIVDGIGDKAKELRGTLSGVFDKFTIPSPSEETIDVRDLEVVAPVKIQSASYVLPHPDKIRWGGEDAVFTKGRTFGVFDGVTGADKIDGLPIYSKTLAKEMKRLVKDEDSLTIPELTNYLAQSKEIADAGSTGASTAVVASISTDGVLRVLNVGDSKCVVIRRNKVAVQAKERVHYFDCPYQLGGYSPDKPRDGTKLNFELQRGDLVLLGSDGVFDNLSNEQVAEIAMKEKASGLGIVAKRIVELSRKVSLDANAATPYAVTAKRYNSPDYQSGLGGKVDDASCIVVSYS
jgi:protein phosphatase PTC7